MEQSAEAKERFSRQAKLFAEEGAEDAQEKLAKAKLVIVGDTILSDILTANALSIGIGDVFRLGCSNFFELDKMNPNSRFEQWDEIPPTREVAFQRINGADIVIDATNDGYTKQLTLHAAQKAGAKYLSATSERTGFEFNAGKTGDTAVTREPQGILYSMIAASLVTDELRKRIAPLRKDRLLESYTFADVGETTLEGRTIIQVGAGAIGTFSAITLYMMGARLRVIDDDAIDISNLSRQYLFYDAKGKNKAQVITERLSQLVLPRGQKRQRIEYTTKRVTPSYDPLARALEDRTITDPVLFSCVDNHRARYDMDGMAYRHGSLLINGGSSNLAGQCVACQRGKTACLDCLCVFELSDSIIRGEEERAKKKLREMRKEPEPSTQGHDCFQPSMIVPNQAVGGLMVLSLLNALNGRYFRFEFNSGLGIVRRDARTKCYGAQCDDYKQKVARPESYYLEKLQKEEKPKVTV